MRTVADILEPYNRRAGSQFPLPGQEDIELLMAAFRAGSLSSEDLVALEIWLKGLSHD